MGVHDLPAEIDWVLNVTGHKKLYYIGHSMGTTISYVMASMRPEYNDKVHFIVSLAPVAFMSRVKSPVRLLVPYIKDIEVNTNRSRNDRPPPKLPCFRSHKTRPVQRKGC